MFAKIFGFGVPFIHVSLDGLIYYAVFVGPTKVTLAHYQDLFEFQQFSYLLSSLSPRSQSRLPHCIQWSCLYFPLVCDIVSQFFPVFMILKFMENASLLFNNPQFRFEKCFPYDRKPCEPMEEYQRGEVPFSSRHIRESIFSNRASH